MINKKILKTIIAVMMMIAFVFAMTACGSQDSGEATDEETTAEATEATEKEVTLNEVTGLNEDEEADLMKQIAEKEQEKRYAEYMPEEVFANAEFFSAEKDGDNVTTYALLNTAEYAAVKGKAYLVGGGRGEVIIKYTYADEGPKLTEIIWSADGGEHDKWLEENFPKEALEKDREYLSKDKNDGNSPLDVELRAMVEEALGVPVESENILEIDEENGTYEIMKTIESGNPENGDYKFETETVEEGKLSDLKE